MSTPSVLRSNWADLYGTSMLPALEELFSTALAQHPSRREILAKIVQTDRDIYQSSEIHDMPLMEELVEGEDYSYNRAKQGANKTLTIKKMGRGFSISKEAIEDGKFSLVAEMTKMLAQSAKESQEIDFMNLFNNGFTTETTADGVAVFSTAHTLPSGGTFSNRPSSDADLSQSSLDTAIQDFEANFVGDSGIIKRLRPKYLVVPSAFRGTAQELLGSDKKPGGQNNDINYFKDEGLVVVSSPHLTDTDAWYLLEEPSKHGMRVVSRKGIETSSKEEFDNDSMKYKASYREQVGVIHPYGVYGNTGA